MNDVQRFLWTQSMFSKWLTSNSRSWPPTLRHFIFQDLSPHNTPNTNTSSNKILCQFFPSFIICVLKLGFLLHIKLKAYRMYKQVVVICVRSHFSHCKINTRVDYRENKRNKLLIQLQLEESQYYVKQKQLQESTYCMISLTNSGNNEKNLFCWKSRQ